MVDEMERRPLRDEVVDGAGEILPRRHEEGEVKEPRCPRRFFGAGSLEQLEQDVIANSEAGCAVGRRTCPGSRTTPRIEPWRL